MTARLLILVFLALAAAPLLPACVPVGGEFGTLPPDPNDSSAQPAPPAVEPDDEEEEQRRIVAAWLQFDSDRDGLINQIELDFGLDPEDPTDGPDIDGDQIPNYRDDDIDGDGVVNATDVDIDGDGLDNSIDADTDGDTLPDRLDADDDADGVRDRWDWDDDNDGQDDADEADKKKDDDDDDEEEEKKLDEAGEKMAQWVDSIFGGEDPPDSEELKDKYAEMAEWADETFGGGDSSGQGSQGLSEPLRRFGAMISQLAARGENGDPKVPQEMRWLLDTLPLKTGSIQVARNSTETRLVVQMISDRFLSGDATRADVDVFVDRLVLAGALGTDVTDALDVLFHQALDIRDPRGTKALDDLNSRITGVIAIVSNRGTTDCSLGTSSDAVSRLARMSGEGSLQGRVDALIRAAAAMEEKPKLSELAGQLEELTKALDARCEKWDWDTMITFLEGAPGIEEGIDSDVIDYVVSEVEES